MNYWNRLWAAALSLCLLLCACADGTPPAEEAGPAPESPPKEPTGIVTDVGQAETVQDYYDRTAIISRNERIEGNFVQTQHWAEEYARLEYPERQSEVQYESGYAAPEALFRDELRGGVACWSILSLDEAGAEARETIQVVYFTETADGTQTQCLSGLLTGGAQLETRPEAYDYLALDPRFSGRMQKLAAPEMPQGGQALELSVEETECFLLSETAAVELTHLRDGSCGLRLFSPEGAFEAQSQTLEGNWNSGGVGPDGVLTLERAMPDGGRQRMEILPTGGLPDIRTGSAAEEDDRWTLGGAVITRREGSLYLGEELLLAGGATDPEDVTTFRSYQFLQALDDHRFLYSLAGWEWVEGCGVYDLESRTATAIGDWGFAMPVIRKEAGVALGAHLTEPGSWAFSLVDLETLELTPLELGYPNEETAFSGQLEANGDLSLLAMNETDWESGDHLVTVREPEGGAEVFRWEIDGRLVAGQPRIQLVNDHLLAVTLRRWDTDTYWLYRIHF